MKQEYEVGIENDTRIIWLAFASSLFVALLSSTYLFFLMIQTIFY